MGLDALLKRLTETPETPDVSLDVSPEPAWIKAETLETCETCEKTITANDTETRHFGWLVHFADRDPVEVYCNPDADLANIMQTYPDALAAEPILGRSRRMRTELETVELTRLVRLCGERYDFTEAEHAEALAIALADPSDALTCFGRMAAKPDIAATVAASSTTGCTNCTHSRKPGRVTRYCSARPDLPPAYGERHPLHCLPADGGTVCEQWGGRQKSKPNRR